MFLTAWCGSTASEQGRLIHEDNLAYPVLITLEGGVAGSGFYLNAYGHMYLVTAAHVVMDRKSRRLKAKVANLLSYPRDPEDEAQIRIRLDLETLIKGERIRSHPKYDAAVLILGETRPRSGVGDYIFEAVDGVLLRDSSETGLIGAEVKGLEPFKEVIVANEVFIFGYPVSLGIKEIPQLDYERPLLRRGIVAGTNPSLKTIVIDCPAYPGNSGSPVVEVEHVSGRETRFLVIGIVAEFVPFAEVWKNTRHGYTNLTLSNSGYAVVMPTDAVLELIEGL